MQVLQEEMGIQRQSLYNTFGSKHDLFLTSLDYYHEQIIVRNLNPILIAESPKQAIKDYFYQRLMDLDDPEVIPGCFITNSVAELGLLDDTVKQRTKRTIEYIERTFNQALGKAKKIGEISAEKNTKLLSLQLLNHAQGLFLISKSGISKNKLNALVREILTLLD